MNILIKKKQKITTCGKNFFKKRKDDNLETIIIRHDEYMKKTKPVLDFYSARNYFYEMDGSEKIQVIANKIQSGFSQV